MYESIFFILIGVCVLCFFEWYQVFKCFLSRHRVCGIVQFLLCSCYWGLWTWDFHWILKNPHRLLLRMRGRPWWGSLFTPSWWICAVRSSMGLISMTRLSAPWAGKASTPVNPARVFLSSRHIRTWLPGEICGVVELWWLTARTLDVT